jgi:hypothetical protein
VQVGVSEEGARREMAIGIRRVRTFLASRRGIFFVDRAGISGDGVVRGEGGLRERERGRSGGNE